MPLFSPVLWPLPFSHEPPFFVFKWHSRSTPGTVASGVRQLLLLLLLFHLLVHMWHFICTILYMFTGRLHAWMLTFSIVGILYLVIRVFSLKTTRTSTLACRTGNWVARINTALQNWEEKQNWFVIYFASMSVFFHVPFLLLYTFRLNKLRIATYT